MSQKKYPLLTVDQMHYAVTRITTHYYGSDNEINPEVAKTATGFFYHNIKNDFLFLITNRHVIKDPDKDYFPNAIKLTLHTDPDDMTQNTDYPIHLYEGTKQIWREPNPLRADVVAIPIDKVDFASHNIRYKSFSTENMLEKRFRLDIGDDIMVMGYPFGIYDHVHNLPLTRGGTISSPHPIPWKGEPYFLVDSNLHEGTSGSPVMTKFKNIWRRVDNDQIDNSILAFFLLGIVSTAFEYPKELLRAELNTVYFANIIDEMTT